MLLKRLNKRGFSLIELMVASSLFIFIFASGFVMLNSYSQGQVKVHTDAKMNQKLRNVAEAIRYEAAANFYNMTESNANRTGHYDTDIKIVSTISNIDQSNNTRTVSLVATKTLGTEEQTTTMNFSVSRTRAKLGGSRLKVRVVVEGTSDGVANIRITAPGQDIPEVSGKTDENGYCQLYGILPKVISQDIWLDGELAKAYFRADTNNPSAAYERLVPVANLLEGQMTDIGIHEIVPPGVIRGRVVNALSGDGIADIELSFHAKAGSTIFDESASPQTSLTDTNGYFVSPVLLAGDYYIPVHGNELYTASDMPGSLLDQTTWSPVYILSAGGDLTIPDHLTVKKGYIQGTIYDVTWNGSQWVPGVPISTNTSIWFHGEYPTNDTFYSYYDPGNFAAYHDLTNSFGVQAQQANSGYGTSFLAYGLGVGVDPDVNGDFTIENPIMVAVHSDHITYPQQDQARYFYAKALDNVHPSLAPVMVYNPGDPATSIYVARASGYTTWQIYPGPPINQWDDIKFPSYGGGLDNPNNLNQEFYVMRKSNSVQSNAIGDITFSDTPPDPSVFAIPGSGKGVFIAYGQNGVGGMGMMEVLPTHNRMVTGGVDTVIDPSTHHHSFDFRNAFGDHTLIPTAPYTQHVTFSANDATPFVNDSNFSGNVVGYYRTAAEPNLYIQDTSLNLPEAGKPGIDIVFAYSSVSGYADEAIISTNVPVVNGVLDLTRPTHAFNGWTAEADVAFEPGVTHTVNMIADRVDINPGYRLRVINNGRWAFIEGTTDGWGTWDKFQNRYGVTPIEVVRIGQATSIAGRIEDTSGNPINGATIELYTAGYLPNKTFTCLPTDNNFTFNPADTTFMMTAETSLRLSVTSASGYDVPTPWVQWHGYDDISIYYVFVLTISGGGGGGGL